MVNSNSIWYFIPKNIFQKVGGLQFLLKCNYSFAKLPLKLSAFHKQVLLAWKICYKHNFSPHRCIIWNNENINKSNKSIFLQKWFERKDLFEDDGQIISYSSFSNSNTRIQLSNQIPTGKRELLQLLLAWVVLSITEPILIDGVDLASKKCSNKHIRKYIQNQNRIIPACKAHWSSKFNNIIWKKPWLNPFKYCLNNKIKEIHWKMIHNVNPTNLTISKFTDKENKCTFCNSEIETLTHLFYDCRFSKEMWSQLKMLISQKTAQVIKLEYDHIIMYFVH